MGKVYPRGRIRPDREQSGHWEVSVVWISGKDGGVRSTPLGSCKSLQTAYVHAARAVINWRRSLSQGISLPIVG